MLTYEKQLNVQKVVYGANMARRRFGIGLAIGNSRPIIV